LFFFFILAATGLSIFPGWLRPTLAVPGAPCTTVNGDLFNASCDVCNGEICTFNASATGGGEDQCAIPVLDSSGTSILSFNFDPAAAPIPNCPIRFDTITVNGNADLSTTRFPDCWNVCTPTPQSNLLVPVCSPSATFCDGLAGGTVANDCRTGVCTANSTFDSGNPTGCDYDYSGGVDCINCAPPTDQAVNCGNGVCEPAIGEDFDSCSVDCRAPDFDSPAPIPEDPDPSNPNPSYPLNEACRQPIAGISFSGNLPGGGTCEDGDVCTTNVCTFVGPNNIPFCDVEPAQCNNAEIDFCCPDGCTPSDDLDCLPPEVCEPTPTASPVELSGTGCSLHKMEGTSK
jgi:hypothetical protein